MEGIKTPVYPNLIAELKKRGITNKKYGEMIGVSQSGISQRLNGKALFTIKEMKKTKELLEKTMDELFL